VKKSPTQKALAKYYTREKRVKKKGDMGKKKKLNLKRRLSSVKTRTKKTTENFFCGLPPQGGVQGLYHRGKQLGEKVEALVDRGGKRDISQKIEAHWGGGYKLAEKKTWPPGKTVH